MGNKIHTVIFDLDGTLSDSALLTSIACKNILPDQGMSIPSEEEIRRAMGYATPEFYYILFPDYSREIALNVADLIEEEELRILPSLGNKLLFRGCRELLERLKENGFRLCIASTGARAHVFPVVETTGIKGFFDTISCERSDKKEMLREMTGSGDKSGYVVVGDMKKDYEAAAANGILSVGACFGYCRRELTNFNLYIDTPLDLLDILKR